MALNNKPTVLVMTDWYEPGYKAGGPIQSCRNIVNTLKDRFNFCILTSDRDLGDTKAYAGIQPDTWMTLPGNVRILYASPAYMGRHNFLKIIDEIKPSVIYFNSMFSLPFTLKPLWYLRGSKYTAKIVLAPRGMLQEGALRKKTLKKKLFLRLFKTLGWHRRIVFHATDAQEKTDILKFFPKSNVMLAENIPNIDYEPWEERMKIPGRLNCVFISRIHPKKNLQFALKALAEVNADCNLLLDVYGEEDDMFYSMDCRKKAGAMTGNSRVTFHGPLPHSEVFRTLKKYHLFVLPTLGENFGHSIFEALTAGLPVLVSDKTPWQNLAAAGAGWELPLSETTQFTHKLEMCCKMDQEAYNKWSRGAKTYAEQFAGNINFFSKYEPLFA